VQSLVFSFVDETKSGHFVRPLDDGLREASVEVVDKSKGSRRALLLRTKCADKTYFFDLTTRPVQPLKPVEPGTMIELLVNKACE